MSVRSIEFDVHTDQWIRTGDALPDARAAWRQAVATVAARAKEALPECNGRVEAAAKLVLAGDVALQADGTATVGSLSDPATTYTVNGTCECLDFPRAPHGGMCKHRIARGLAMRAHELLRSQAAALDGQAEAPAEAPPAPAVPRAAAAGLPEAPASANVHVKIGGRMVQITLRDSDEDRLMARMERMMARYPVEEAAPTQAATVPKEPAEGWCAVCQVQMRWNAPRPGDTRPGWWSHRLDDGSFCKGKARKAGRAGQ